MERIHLVHPFPPLVDGESRILILGSFPSVKSRAQGFFYGHPQNRFWPMLARIFGEDAPRSIEEKAALAHRHHLALWDSIYECDIVGSSDSSIRGAVPIPIGQILKTAPIERVLCNGTASARLYTRYLEKVTGLPCWVMPSTSPANAAWSMERLQAVWEAAITAPPGTPPQRL